MALNRRSYGDFFKCLRSKMAQQGIEPRPTPRERVVLPLDYWAFIKIN